MKIRHLLLLAIFIQISFGQQKKSAVELYVSPSGSDSNTGTESKPFKSIERARDFVRSMGEMKADVNVNLKGGEYLVTKTLVFGTEDSGKNGFTVNYKAYKNEVPVISGGIQIKGWTKFNGKIYRAKFTGEKFRQLYVNEKKAVRARTPEHGNFFRLKYWDYKHKEVIVDTAQTKLIQDVSGIEMIPHLHWAEQVLHVKEITKTKEYAYITFNEPEQSLIFKRDNPIKAENESYHFENAFEFLDTEGEWFHNEKEGYVYYIPRKGEDLNKVKVIVPQLETLLKIEGTVDNPVKNLVFSGIRFSHSNWNLPSKTGVCFAQAGQYTVNIEGTNTQYFKRPESAILVNFADNIKFEKNIFMNLGSTGLDLYKGVSNSAVIGNIFYKISGNGISIAKFSEADESQVVMYNPKDEREGCSDNRIANNLITEVCDDYINTCGIAAGYPRGLLIEHNEIYNLPYSGVSVGWGWEDKPNFMKNNIIRWNHIYDVLKILCDGGGIYTLSRQPESEISNNYIHDIYRSHWAVGSLNNGIFLDQGSSGILLKKNVFRNIQEGNTRHNMTGELKYVNNEYFDPATIINAGLEKEFRYLLESPFIKNK